MKRIALFVLTNLAIIIVLMLFLNIIGAVFGINFAGVGGRQLDIGALAVFALEGGRTMTDITSLTASPVPGTVVVFMIGQTCMNLEATEIVEIKAIRSAPSYPDVIPKQKVIKQETRSVDGREVAFLVKAYLPDVLVVEASVYVNDILDDATLEFKRRLVIECRRILAEYVCNKDFDEEYSVYCISGYQGDPEVYLSLYGDRIVAFLQERERAA